MEGADYEPVCGPLDQTICVHILVHRSLEILSLLICYHYKCCNTHFDVTYSRARARAHTLSLSLSLSLSHTHTHTHSLSLSLSLTHTHTQTSVRAHAHI